MTKLHSNIFLLILIQTLLAVIIGLALLFYSVSGTISPNTFVGTSHIGGLDKKSAAVKLEKDLSSILKTGHITIKYGEGKKEFKIDYADIDASIDYAASAKMAFGQNRAQSFVKMVNGYFFSRTKVISPVFTFNERKMKDELSKLAVLIDKDPVNARIYLNGSQVIKIPEKNGTRLNIDNAYEKLNSGIGLHMDSFIEFKSSDNYEIQTVIPKYISGDFEDAENVISSYSTTIQPGQDLDSIKLAVYSIDKVMLLPNDQSGKTYEFSFNKQLKDQKAIIEQNNEGYNQVASTLYAAVLTAGIDQGAITRVPHKTPVDYIDPGLDATVFGNSVDFKFINNMGCKLIIFAEIKDNKVIVSLIGKKEGNTQNSIKVEVQQKYKPSIIDVENQDLPSGQKKLISPGKEGVKVNVYLVTFENGVETVKKFIYSDKYDAVEAIQQIGPNTPWDDTSDK